MVQARQSRSAKRPDKSRCMERLKALVEELVRAGATPTVIIDAIAQTAIMAADKGKYGADYLDKLASECAKQAQNLRGGKRLYDPSFSRN